LQIRRFGACEGAHAGDVDDGEASVTGRPLAFRDVRRKNAAVDHPGLIRIRARRFLPASRAVCGADGAELLDAVTPQMSSSPPSATTMPARDERRAGDRRVLRAPGAGSFARIGDMRRREHGCAA